MENYGDIAPIEIDLNAVKSGKMDEFNWLRAFGSGVKTILGAMFGGGSVPVSVRGSPSQVRSFANVLGKEKKYMSSWKKYGLDNPRTYRSKSKLDSSVGKFERTTGLKWPFK